LVTVADGRVAGVVNGRFDPAQASASEGSPVELPRFFFAFSAEYGAVVLEAEGFEVI
jgi:hypothetical protein